ncbi:MAG: RES family NAD+ phosphorylase [Saprospiraceae bacterium]|nr:RES family NAD+ phosphorylase [Saprospiraceae bacterium]
MLVFRLTRKKYMGQLSGVGAALYPGRWNRKGQEVIYTAESRALALVEVLVHLAKDLVPSDYYLQTIEIPDDLPIGTITSNALPPHWYDPMPANETRLIGAAILQNQCLMRVPSAIVQDEWNLLINPHQTGFERIVLLHEEPFSLDVRFFSPPGV